ncbi:hypothetical protein [Mycolicibacterium psychrotolerans]|uniref:Uncharacterized protein n=1 Tax=Mycolicibacterium psychrotolerans TaxID=216929 RepID=A0A7I7M6T9_9MYCO|nr:hypothetical protein [Mycolicibacterium psychrotolerans]BBX67710.1 hypothetical protein MPSYJ_11710 [Mycolicibacterium psychrotolerans]
MTHVIRQAPAALLAAGAAVVLASTAQAQPPLPPEPPAPPPSPGPTIPVIGAPLGSNGWNVLAQSNPQGPTGPLGVPEIPGIQRDTVLGQNPVPSAPGAGPGVVPSLRAFNNAYGVPQNEVPAAPGQGQQFDVAPGDENADVNGRTWLGRYIDLYRDGRLRGSLLGQSPQQQLGEPLPGTAPPRGTNIPPGLVQFLPDPAGPAPEGPQAMPVVPPA